MFQNSMYVIIFNGDSLMPQFVSNNVRYVNVVVVVVMFVFQWLALMSFDTLQYINFEVMVNSVRK